MTEIDTNLKRAAELLTRICVDDGPLETEYFTLHREKAPCRKDVDGALCALRSALEQTLVAVARQVLDDDIKVEREQLALHALEAFDYCYTGAAALTKAYRPRQKYTPKPQTEAMGQVVADLREAVQHLHVASRDHFGDDVANSHEDLGLSGEALRSVLEQLDSIQDVIIKSPVAA